MWRSVPALLTLIVTTLSGSLVQAADTYAFVAQTSNASTFSFLNPVNGKQVGGLPLRISAGEGAMYSPDGTLAFVIEVLPSGNRRIAGYDLRTGKPAGSVTFGTSVIVAFAVSPTSGNLFVVTFNGGLQPHAIYVVDTATFTAKLALETPEAFDTIAVSPEGGTLYLSTATALVSISSTTFQQTSFYSISNIVFITVSPDGNRLYLSIVIPNAIISAFDLKKGMILGSFPGDGHVGISPDSSTLYSTLQTGNSVVVQQISAATFTVLNSAGIAPASLGPPFLAISPDGSTLAVAVPGPTGIPGAPSVTLFALPSFTLENVTFVGNACGVAFPSPAYISVTNCGADTVDVVDLITSELKASLDAGPSPQYTLPSRNTPVLYVSNEFGVWALSRQTGKVIAKVEFPGSLSNGQLALSADGATLFATYTSGVMAIATSNNQLLGSVPGIPSRFLVNAIATSPDGKFLFVAGTAQDFSLDNELLVLDQSKGTLLSTVSTFSQGIGEYLVPSKDGSALYFEASMILAGYSLSQFDIASETFSNIPSDVYGPMALSPDGKTLYIASRIVEAIDTTTLAFIGIPSPVPATGIAVAPGGSHLVVTSSSSSMGVITIANPSQSAEIQIGGATAGISLP